MPSSKASKQSSRRNARPSSSKRGGPAKKKPTKSRPTIEVPDGEGWTRTVEIPLEEKAIPNPNLNKSSWKRWKRETIALLGFQAKANGVTDEQHLFSELGVNREKAVKSFNNGFGPSDFVQANQHYIAVNKKGDEPPQRSRFDGDIKSFSSYDLSKELTQIKIDYECGPGPTTREKIKAREENIRDELARRNALTEEALERENRRRGKGKLQLKDATVEVVLTTREVYDRIERWAEACRTGNLDTGKVDDVKDLVYSIQQEMEQWIEVLEGD